MNGRRGLPGNRPVCLASFLVNKSDYLCNVNIDSNTKVGAFTQLFDGFEELLDCRECGSKMSVVWCEVGISGHAASYITRAGPLLACSPSSAATAPTATRLQKLTSSKVANTIVTVFMTDFLTKFIFLLSTCIHSAKIKAHAPQNYVM